MLEEMGTTLPKDKTVRVCDSSAEIRYMVLPQMPPEWSDLSESDLAERVSRASMIGVELLGLDRSA